jgi:hypothetical protein
VLLRCISGTLSSCLHGPSVPVHDLLPTHLTPALQTVRNKGERLLSAFDVSSQGAVAGRLARHGLALHALHDAASLARLVCDGSAAAAATGTSSPAGAAGHVLPRVPEHTSLASLDPASAKLPAASCPSAIKLTVSAANSATAPTWPEVGPSAAGPTSSSSSSSKGKLKLPQFFYYVEAYKP